MKRQHNSALFLSGFSLLSGCLAHSECGYSDSTALSIQPMCVQRPASRCGTFSVSDIERPLQGAMLWGLISKHGLRELRMDLTLRAWGILMPVLLHTSTLRGDFLTKVTVISPLELKCSCNNVDCGACYSRIHPSWSALGAGIVNIHCLISNKMLDEDQIASSVEDMHV